MGACYQKMRWIAAILCVAAVVLVCLSCWQGIVYHHAIIDSKATTAFSNALDLQFASICCVSFGTLCDVFTTKAEHQALKKNDDERYESLYQQEYGLRKTIKKLLCPFFFVGGSALVLFL